MNSEIFTTYLSPFFQILGAIISITTLIKLISLWLKNLFLPKLDYWDLSEIRNYKKYYIETNCQDSSPAHFNEPIESIGQPNRINLISFFLDDAFLVRRNQNKYYLILADSGMGKTTFLVNLYLRYKRKKGLFKKDITLIPFGKYDTDNDIQNKIPKEKQSNTILLLDAFDEDEAAALNYNDRLSEILKWTEKFHKIVITCRTQFFPSQNEEPLETGLVRLGGTRSPHLFVKKYISPFNDLEVEAFIKKKFSIFNQLHRKRARSVVKKCPNLMVRPMLLSYVEFLVQTTRTLDSQTLIYEELVTQWINREAGRYPPDKIKTIKNKLYTFSLEIAKFIYQNKREQLSLTSEEIQQFANDNNIELNAFEMKTKSLLNRNGEVLYKFSHKSILEYFLAVNLFENRIKYNDFSFVGFDQCKKFYDELFYSKHGATQMQKILESKKIKNQNIEKSKKATDLNIHTEQLLNAYSVDMKMHYWNEESYSEVYKFLNAKELKMNSFDLNDMKLFECLYNLKKLDLGNNEIESIEFLSMPNLEVLDLSKNKIKYIKRLELPSLKTLRLNDNHAFYDLEPFKNLTSLKELYVSNTLVSSNQASEFSRKTGCTVFLNSSGKTTIEMHKKFEGGYQTAWINIGH